jgi:hypothetical protein
MPPVPLVSEVFNRTMAMNADATDEAFRTSCAVCGREQRLSESGVADDPGGLTTYTCVDACGPVLIVDSHILDEPVEGWGYRIDEWVIRNRSDLFFRPAGALAEVFFPASPTSFD